MLAAEAVADETASEKALDVIGKHILDYDNGDWRVRNRQHNCKDTIGQDGYFRWQLMGKATLRFYYR